MATQISDALAEVRDFLLEKKARFWTDTELKAIYRLGCMNLWGAILDLHQDHYSTVNDTDVYQPANKSKLAGIPQDCFRILLIEPRDISITGSGRRCIYFPRKYNHADFVGARTRTALDPGSTGTIYYRVSGVGAPIEPPTVDVAPLITADLPLRIEYCPTITVGDQNPIPGESDNALKAWTLAYAMGKEQPAGGRIPDPGWLQIYATEKQEVLTRLTPRQEQEPDVVDDFFILN